MPTPLGHGIQLLHHNGEHFLSADPNQVSPYHELQLQPGDENIIGVVPTKAHCSRMPQIPAQQTPLHNIINLVGRADTLTMGAPHSAVKPVIFHGCVFQNVDINKQ